MFHVSIHDICINISSYIDIHIYTYCIFAYLYIYIYTFHFFIYLYLHMCIYIYIYIYIYISCIYTDIYTHISCFHLYIYIYIPSLSKLETPKAGVPGGCGHDHLWDRYGKSWDTQGIAGTAGIAEKPLGVAELGSLQFVTKI